MTSLHAHQILITERRKQLPNGINDPAPCYVLSMCVAMVLEMAMIDAIRVSECIKCCMDTHKTDLRVQDSEQCCDTFVVLCSVIQAAHKVSKYTISQATIFQRITVIDMKHQTLHATYANLQLTSKNVPQLSWGRSLCSNSASLDTTSTSDEDLSGPDCHLYHSFRIKRRKQELATRSPVW